MKKLLAELLPEVQYKNAPLAKARLAHKLQELYNAKPMYHMRRRIDYEFRAFKRLTEEIKVEWRKTFLLSQDDGDEEDEDHPPEGESHTGTGPNQAKARQFGYGADTSMW